MFFFLRLIIRKTTHTLLLMAIVTKFRFIVTSGTQYYGHDGYSPLDAYPRSLHHHKALRVLLERGVTNVNAAVQWINKKNYFFSDGQYYRWTHGSGDGYMTGPLSTAWNWLGCSNGSLQ